MVIEQGAQSRKGGGVYRGYLIFLTFLLQLQRGSDLFNPQAASDVSVANQTEILWVQFFTHRDNHKVYSVVAPHCTQQDPGFEAASGLCESVPTPRQRISAEEPMECVDMDETALPDPGWKTFKSKELQAASVFLVGHLAMQVLAANSKPMVGSMVLLGALLCIGIIWILGWKTLKSKELQERKDFMKQKNRDPETRPKKIGRSCWFKSCGRSHRPACRDFRCVTTVGWPSGGYKLADPPWEDPLCHGTPFGTDPKLCESEPTSSPPTSSQPTSLLTTVLSSLCLLWVILRWFPLIGKAAPSLWKTIACRRISSKEPMECVDMVETADPGTTTAAELFYLLRSRACSASGRGTGGAGGTSSAVSLMLNPILLLTALVESALLGDQSWRIWVQVIGFLITACLLLCNFHLKSEKCKCLSLALVLLQLPIGCSFVEALVRCLCVWAFPMFPADDSEADQSEHLKQCETVREVNRNGLLLQDDIFQLDYLYPNVTTTMAKVDQNLIANCLAASSKLIYKADTSQKFQELMMKETNVKGKYTQKDTPFIKCNIPKIPEGHLRWGWFLVCFPFSETEGDVCLCFAFRGTADVQDILRDVDTAPTATQCEGIRVFSGMHGVFNAEKEGVEKVMLEVLEVYKERLQHIFYAGHSLGGGVGNLFQFEHQAAEASHHWPLNRDIRALAKKTCALSFGGPSIFYVPQPKERTQRVKDVMKTVEDRSVNAVMEFDVVWQLSNKKFAEPALTSYAMSMPPDTAISGLLNRAISSLALRGFKWLENAVKRDTAHLSQVWMHHVVVPDSTWTWLKFSSESDRLKLEKIAWPFNGVPTKLGVEDHFLLPGRVYTDWRSDICCICCCLFGGCQQQGQVTFCDCIQCGKSFCEACYQSEHQKKAGRGLSLSLNWHGKETRAVQIYPHKGLITDRMARDWVAEDLKLQFEWKHFLMSLGKDCFRPVSCVLLMDVINHGAYEVAKQIFTQVPPSLERLKLTKGDLAMTGAVVALELGYLLYHRLWTGQLNCSQFWRRVTDTLAGAMGSLAGTAAGIKMGVLIGQMWGPVGSLVGGVLGGIGGSLLGNKAGKFCAKALVDHLAGCDEHEQERVTFVMLVHAKHRLGLSHRRLEDLTTPELNKAFREMALKYHPDKAQAATSTLSQEEMTQKMQVLNHDRLLLASFISERSQGKFDGAKKKRIAATEEEMRPEYQKAEAGVLSQAMEGTAHRRRMLK